MNRCADSLRNALIVAIATSMLRLVAYADVRLPALISDHMVLQQDMPVRLWGWATAGEKVSATFRDKTYITTTDSDGSWQLVLPSLKPGPGSDMTVTGQNRLVVHDVLVGEVWLASGQSNMALNMDTALNPAEEESHADYPAIRLFHVDMAVREAPASDVRGEWELCSPASVKKFSAVAYYFGRDLQQHRRFPVGLIEASIGGTPVEAWTSEETLRSDASLSYVYTEWQAHLEDYPANKAKYDEQLKVWQATHRGGSATDDEKAPAKPVGPGHPWSPSGLYNGMIVPISPFTLRGVIWYQGEWNSRDEAHSIAYRRVFPMMIENWRALWGRLTLPFLFVQLPNFTPVGSWVTLRASQASALELRNTGMVVAIDVGDPKNIHPKNKLPIGERLSLTARATVYGEAVEYSGPMLHQAMRDGVTMRVWFDHSAGLTTSSPGELTGFEIAGRDRVFVAATARIDNGTVVVSSASVPEPVTVRYAWANNPVANLTNSAKLPAGPFNTLWKTD